MGQENYLKSWLMGIGGLGNMGFINKAAGFVNPALIRGGRILRLTLRFAISGGAEREDIFPLLPLSWKS